MSRQAEIKRATRETDIHLKLDLDGEGKSAVSTGVPFLDHMLELFARHGLFDLEVTCRGDLQIDDHHSVEDTAICLAPRTSFIKSGTRATESERFPSNWPSISGIRSPSIASSICTSRSFTGATSITSSKPCSNRPRGHYRRRRELTSAFKG